MAQPSDTGGFVHDAGIAPTTMLASASFSSSYVGYTGDSIQSDINQIDETKTEIENEPKITSSTQSKQDDSDTYYTTAENAVNNAKNAINSMNIMLSILCGSDDGIIDKKTEILTQKLTTPPRVHIKELSNRRGEYPTILRTGDIDRWGNFNVSFDDKNVVKFNRHQDVIPGTLTKDFTYKQGTAGVASTDFVYDQSDKLIVQIPLVSIDDVNESGLLSVGTKLENTAPSLLTPHAGEGVYTSSTSPYDPLFGKLTSLQLRNENSAIVLGDPAAWNALIGTEYDDSIYGTTRTISTWVNATDYGPDIADSSGVYQSKWARIFEFGNHDISLFIYSSGKLKFVSRSAYSSSNYQLETLTDDPQVTLEQWMHIAVTYDISVNDVKIYINGELVASSTTASTSYFQQIDDNTCLIGNRQALDRRFNGSISNFAVWNTALDADAVKAIYLNDAKWVSNLKNIVHFPSMLEEDDNKLLPDSVAYSAMQHDPPPTTMVSLTKKLNSDIVSQGRVLKGIGDETFDIYTPGEDISAFSDNPNKIGTSGFYMTGTEENVYPGFTSPLKSKTSFTIDITPEEDHVLARCPATWMSGSTSTVSDPRLHLSGSATEGPHSGFAYFTFCQNIWEDVGIVDYVNPLNTHDHEIRADRTVLGDLYSGTIRNPSQFIPANDFRAKNTVDIEEYSDAKFFASPTMAHDAPNNTKYFAKQAQEITLPISSPFLLEKISLNVPISYFNTYDKRNEESCIKTIDSLVFFLYHQRTNVGHEISSLLDETIYRQVVTGSVRTLIASGSAAFWQKTRSYQPDSGDVINNSIELHHSPSFDYDWSVEHSLTRDSGDDDVVTFEKDLNVEIQMVPAVSQNAFKSRNKYPVSTNGIALAPSPLYHKWFQGTRENQHIQEDCFVYSDGGTPSPRTESRWDYIPQMKAQFPNRFVKGKTGAANSEIVLFGLAPLPKTSKEPSSVAPYVLLPGDSLILGVEYLPCMPFYTPTDVELKYLSSSYVTIKAEPASMTMYGSLIKENKEYHETRNQDLTSLSIHEAMHSNPTLDQFEIEPGLMYSGSMLNEYVLGDIYGVSEYSVGRYVAGNASLDSGLTSWSLLRGVKTIDETERFYDTLLPDMLEYSKTLKDYEDSSGDLWKAEHIELHPNAGALAGETHQLAIIHNRTGTANDGAFWPYLNTFPFESFTLRNDAKYRFYYAHTGIFSTPPWFPDILDNHISRKFLFMEGISDTEGGGASPPGVAPSPHAIHDVLGQTGGCYGFKYGVRNITPINTSAVYRHQHYGYFRDMLEQRQFSRFYKKSIGLANQSIFKYGMQPAQSYVTQGPLSVKFVEPNTETITDPMDTFTSSNIDNHATSSIPFIDDGNTYNRSFEEIVVP